MAEPRDTARMLAIPRALFAVVVIAAAWYSSRQRHRDANGTIVLDGTQITIDGCKTMGVASPDSIGADLRSSDRNVLRLLRDENGVQLWLYPEGSSVAIPIEQRDCSQWEMHFFSGATNSLTPIGGSANFKCAIGGRKIDGLTFFEHCRP